MDCTCPKVPYERMVWLQAASSARSSPISSAAESGALMFSCSTRRWPSSATCGSHGVTGVISDIYFTPTSMSGNMRFCSAQSMSSVTTTKMTVVLAEAGAKEAMARRKYPASSRPRPYSCARWWL